MVTLDYFIDIGMAKKEIDKEDSDHHKLHVHKIPRLEQNPSEVFK